MSLPVGARAGAKATACVAALLSAAIMSAQQQPPRDNRATPTANTAPSGTGVISGSVIGDDGRAVRYGYVVLLGTTTGVVKVSSTDADGRFTFSNLPVDRFTVGASKAPYLAMIAGAKRPGRPGTPIALAAGQKIANVAIRMPMGGAISGTITDESGQPGAGMLVGLLQWRMQGTERVLQNVGPVIPPDDQGRYRFFGLQPGEYVVTAMKTSAPQPPRVLTTAEVDAALNGSTPTAAPPAQVRLYAPAYFPGTTRAAEATPIVLTLGEERNNVDFRTDTVPAARVEGVVMTADGQPASNVSVVLGTTSGSLAQRITGARVMPDGRFSFNSVSPGSYVLLVSSSGPSPAQFARGEIEVAGADVFGVQLTMRPAMTMAGRVAFDSALPPSLLGRRIPFRPLTSAGAGIAGIGAATMSTVSDKNTFSVVNMIPGRYLLGGTLTLGATADTMIWSLQSVIVDGRDVTDLPLEIGDAAPKDVVVTYTDKWQELSGRLQSQSGAAVSDYTILVFPEDKAYWIQGTRRIVTARPGTDGRFVLSGKGPTTLPPGKYLIAAVTDIGRDEQFDPAFLAQIVPAAIPITLATGEKKTQDLAIR